MAKVLLVEDDNNLREIYEARLAAEGYEIVSAQDGEEALVVAKKEQPDLVISDVMMPRVSGFEMLDILRNTQGLKDVKVIMLTALGQAEDQTRANSLGADRYLVKSQVTLEDIVKAAAELIGGGTPAPAPAAPATPAPAPVATVPVAVAPEPAPAVAPAPNTPTPAPAAPSVPAPEPMASTMPAAPAAPEPVAPVAPAPAANTDSVTINGKRVIQPTGNMASPQSDLNELLAKEGISNLDHDEANPATPHAPGHVITPSGPATPNGPASSDPGSAPIDPTKISL